MSDTATCGNASVYSGPDTDAVTVTGTCVDAVGNEATATFGPFKYDETAAILSSAVSPNPVYRDGSATVTSDVTDAGAVPDSEECTAVDTSSTGTKSVTCITTDLAGRFLEPLDGDVVNVANAGKVIPIKWRIVDGQGLPLANLTTASITTASLSSDTFTAGTDQMTEYAIGSSGLQNLGDGYYQINWKSPK